MLNKLCDRSDWADIIIGLGQLIFKSIFHGACQSRTDFAKFKRPREHDA